MAFALGPLASRPRISPGLPFQCAFSPDEHQLVRCEEMGFRFLKSSTCCTLSCNICRDKVGFPPSEQCYESNLLLCTSTQPVKFHPSLRLKRQAQSSSMSCPSENTETDVSAPNHHVPWAENKHSPSAKQLFHPHSPQTIRMQRAVPCQRKPLPPLFQASV